MATMPMIMPTMPPVPRSLRSPPGMAVAAAPRRDWVGIAESVAVGDESGRVEKEAGRVLVRKVLSGLAVD